jgi:metal-dependent amidase/aminoacylase/carboxypeptidase family protein
MESYVRGRTVEAIFNANQKVNRAIQAGADAVGAEVEIKDIPGYLPLNNYANLLNLFEQNLEGIVPQERVIKEKSFAGSFDMGDLSHIMPTLHPFFSGVKGSLHSKNFQTVNYDQAVIKPAKALAKTIIDILIDKKNIFKQLKTPPYTKEEYLEILSNMESH